MSASEKDYMEASSCPCFVTLPQLCPGLLQDITSSVFSLGEEWVAGGGA